MEWSNTGIAFRTAAAVFVALASFIPTLHADDVKVGLIGTYSGQFARFGKQYDQAIAVYQKHHGEYVNGHRIVIVKRDEGGPDPAKGRQLAEELVLREQVKILAGFTWTPNTLSAAPFITKAKIPSVIFNAATGPIVRASPFFVRSSNTLGQVATASGTWAAQNGIKNVVTVVADFAPGHDLEKFFTETFKANGGQILESIRVPLATTDLAPFYERAKAQTPDAIFAFFPNAIAQVNTWVARLKPSGIKLLGTIEIAENDMLNFSREAVGVISASHYTETNDTPLNKRMRADLVAMFGNDAVPDHFTVGAYDGMHIIYEIVRKLGPNFSPEDAMKLVAGMSFDSPRGRIQINNERDVTQDIDIRRVEERDGRLVNIAIDKIKNVPPIK